MRFAGHTLDDFSRLVASEHPTPGGGSSAAVIGALGISLLVMAAAISAKKNPRLKADLERIQTDAEALRRRFLDLADEDSRAYDRISFHTRALSSVSSLSSLSSLSFIQAQDALKAGIAPARDILGASLEGLSLAKALAEDYYGPIASDLGLAARCLRTAACGAELTALINLPGITDRAFRTRCQQETRAMTEQAARIAKEVCRAVRERLIEKLEKIEKIEKIEKNEKE